MTAVTTRAQREALRRLFLRDYDTSYEPPAEALRAYRAFRRARVSWGGVAGDRYLVVRLWGMYIGIESDGHTHT
jgi:hypothetical protein